MSFALEVNEPLSASVTRIAVEQIDLALRHIHAPLGDLSHTVHTTRQCLKRLRALMVLAHDGLGDTVYRNEWICYRDAGRLLAGGRDAEAVLEAYDRLERRCSSELSEETVAWGRRVLTNLRDARLEAMVEEDLALVKVAETLDSARERVSAWPVVRVGFRSFRKGMRELYRAGRDGLRSVIRRPSPANFHEWRKPVKLLWHQLQILSPIWPAVLHAHAEELRALSDRLNENHDLDVLRRSSLFPAVESHHRFRRALVPLVDRRCRELEAEALALGERLYAERSRRFTARLSHYWDTRRQLTTIGK